MSEKLDLSKPLLLGSAGRFYNVVAIPAHNGCFFVKSGKNYWLVNPDGEIPEHLAWSVKNEPPPPVTYTATVIWYHPQSGGNHPCNVLINSPDGANIFQRDLHLRFISRQEVSITV